MSRELHHAERLTYGRFRYRLRVRQPVGGFRRLVTYQAILGDFLSPEWYTDDRRVWNLDLCQALDQMLGEALAANRCPPAPLPPAWVPERVLLLPGTTGSSQRDSTSTRPCGEV